MEVVSPFQEGIEAVKEAGGGSFKLCYQCGMCNTACPWNTVTTFMIRRMVRQANFGFPEIEGEDVWLCATCRNCVRRCPRGVEIIDVFRSLRRIALEWGILPEGIRRARASLAAEGNPWGEERRKRADWAEGLPVKTFTQGTEVLYFPCCVNSYDPRLKKVAVATADILNKAGVDFGILGASDSCCGESIRKIGDEEQFQRLARENIDNFTRSGVKKILVSSPHCYQSFKNEYGQLGGDFEVVHISQFLARLLSEGKLKFTRPYNKKIVYHDPCYLGRHNGIYHEPRQVLKSIPGVELMEFVDCREESLCCGGGGGRIWTETPKGQRFSDIKLEQAVQMGAAELVTFCPYCILNFEASRLGLENSDVIGIKDIAEIVQESI
ncbi:MAG: (Fe-S)-binding protein [Chloroflexi bacterium]|nr:(Fe-S)-binding protein [Chloroflexota bacterium]